MIPILQPGGELEEPPVFGVAFVGVPGQASENGPESQHVGQNPQNALDQKKGDKHMCYANHHCHRENHNIQLVVTVAALHKLPETGSKISEKSAVSIHNTITFDLVSFLSLYCN
jgi:hypothetical protein